MPNRTTGTNAMLAALWTLCAVGCGSTSTQTDAGTQDTGIGPDGAAPLPFCSDHGVPRACGLRLAGGARTCAPGAMVTVGCNQGCAPPLGTCAGDTVLQVCPGNATAPCATAVGYNDDSPSSAHCATSAGGVSTLFCSSTTFACPSDGSFTVWVGSYSETRPAFACVIGVR